ncbi:response regulator [Cohnella lubricantis]|uniref:Response regulator n=1 Tax=Cohnella lubricantis TaxID=2163172 RepID=A0A841TAB2_9BACL|nr:response regulator [Cohnella lubricantis]MBB6677922.1 response regulator [Cohnella lubricantis]MBP2120327.1 two-component system response regulator YesN [Cohnella lubricantis]
MYSVLIVDDEPWVAYGIRALIDWDSLGFSIIGEAHNGEQALELITERKPSVVISDIRMPKLNGIELLESISKMGLHTKVVFISGYAEFEYAQQAITFGAYAYLLKQVRKQELTDTLLRLKKELINKKNGRKELDLLLEDLFDLFRPSSTITIGNFLTNRGINFKYSNYRFISSLYPQSTEWEVGDELDADDPEPTIQWICFRTGQRKLTYLVNYDEAIHPYAHLDVISTKLAEAEFIGISSIGLYSSMIGKLYEESDIAAATSKLWHDQRETEYQASDYLNALVKTIYQIELNVKEQRHQHIKQALDDLCSECKERRIMLDQLSITYNQIVSLFYKYYGDCERTQGIEYMSYSQMANSINSVEQLFDRFKEVFDQHPSEEMLISNDAVKKIIRYLDANFTEDISLGEWAKHFNVSIGYLSAQIKKETGTTYLDHIVSKRLNKAKELLASTTLTVQEVVERVGYKDYFHFTKLFKKKYGITPSKYRKL